MLYNILHTCCENVSASAVPWQLAHMCLFSTFCFQLGAPSSGISAKSLSAKLSIMSSRTFFKAFANATFLAEAAGITATVAKRIASMLLLSSSMAATTNITLALRN